MDMEKCNGKSGIKSILTKRISLPFSISIIQFQDFFDDKGGVHNRILMNASSEDYLLSN